ncbi:DUF3675 domain-containing protein/RINGv domain-containing protein [Cucumis melo var. makuwa]|uniref:DUF3675 domain-containing protein/RINGv domain-containing protein n=1 Tax=Cucumis melo var. makuwa TaxID=1194695 RepID=A0A5A7TTY1_CUCMM|nr:DUF3675 domain-containing protein/RINGv domain-containing protein [Cucumis melo var. makuwa]TYK30483.1 DUF3675 domain-containing protein/RINGv domain-containing protein [Cucumis melo var. makuwa]
MGDHFVLLVDRLLTESTLEAAIESRKPSTEATSSAMDGLKRDRSSPDMGFENIPSPKKIVECRICQDEDEDSNMETPCSCCGSLKYAHRRCIQKWCNEKGDTICEICRQQYEPGYTAPPPLFEMGRIPMNFRGNWEISRRNLDSPSYIAMVSSNRNVADPGYDEFSASAATSVLCCHSVAIIFMVLLVLRHSLPLIFNESGGYSFPLLLTICLRTFGIFLPVYVMFKVVFAVHRRRLLLATSHSSLISSSSIARSSTSQSPQPQPYIIRVRKFHGCILVSFNKHGGKTDCKG